MGAALTIEHRLSRYLETFCAPKRKGETERYSLSAPFIAHGLEIFTDGRILLAVPTEKEDMGRFRDENGTQCLPAVDNVLDLIKSGIENGHEIKIESGQTQYVSCQFCVCLPWKNRGKKVCPECLDAGRELGIKFGEHGIYRATNIQRIIPLPDLKMFSIPNSDYQMSLSFADGGIGAVVSMK